METVKYVHFWAMETPQKSVSITLNKSLETSGLGHFSQVSNICSLHISTLQVTSSLKQDITLLTTTESY